MKTFYVSPSYRCNEFCVFCPCARQARQYDMLDPDFIIHAIDLALEKELVEMVVISGGEPTLYPGLFTIIDAIKERHLQFGILSNSLRFADKGYLSGFIERVGVGFELTTAFHSHVPETHDAVTSIRGSFNRSLTGIKNLISSGVHVTVKMVINNMSYRTLPEYARWIYTTFPDEVNWVLCNIDLCGAAFDNRDVAAVAFNESRPYLEKALDVVIDNYKRGRNRRVNVYNTPFCCIDPFYWKFLQRYESEVKIPALLLPPKSGEKPTVKFDLEGDSGAHFEQCENCAVKGMCPGTWKQTAEFFGHDMFKPFKAE